MTLNLINTLAELDETVRSNLLTFVERELAREYAPKHRNKALKMSPDAIAALKLSGERMTAEVREGGKSYRTDMTFPLFDLDNDYTLLVCSCQRDVLSLEAQRCAHMYFFQDKVRIALEVLKQKAASADDPLQSLTTLLEISAEEDEDRWLKEFRWRWIFDANRFTLHFEQEARDRYEPDAAWRWVRNLNVEEWLKLEPGRARAATPEQDVFDLFLEAKLKGVSLSDGHRTLTLESSTWSFSITEDANGLSIKPDFPPKHLCVEGRGVIGWFEQSGSLTLIELHAREEQFLHYLTRMNKPFPLEHKERVLEMLGRMDSAVFRLNAENTGPDTPAAYQAILRLTPFKRGGMRIELRMQIETGLCLVPGTGSERVTKVKGNGSWERDLREEVRKGERLVEALGLEYLPQPEPGVWIAFNDGKALECVARIEEQKGKADFIVEWPSFLAKKTYDIAAPLTTTNLKVSVGEKKDWLSVEGWLELDDGHKLSLRDVLKTIKRRNNYLQLPDGRWSLIPEHFKDKLEPLAASIDIEDETGEMTLNLSALDDEAQLAAIEQFPFQESSKKFWSLVARARKSRETIVTLPSGLDAELRPYQKEGFFWLSRLAEWGLGACLADDMGLGKTVQTLAILLSRQAKGPSLVIAPSSLSYNWQNEAAKFAPELRIIQMRELSGRGLGMSFKAGDVVVASYGMIMRYAENLSETKWNVLVLDEAQLIKNALTKTAGAVQTLDAEWRVALSGTPIENHLGDLWSLFRTISPGLFGEWEKFKRSYVYPIERENSEVAKLRLKNKIAPFVLRRMKKDYLTELPEKTEVDLWIDLSTEEQTAYDAMRGEAIEKVQILVEEDPEAKTQMQILAALTRLRQAACHRALVDESYEGTSSKVEALKARLEELKDAGHAALVFSQFTRFLKIIQRELKAQGLKVLYLDGSTPAKERLRLVDEFQQGDYDVFLISLKAGGTGLNLTRASYVFHLDPWWNPAIENQASDRAYRMGQKRAVTVYRMRSRGTIEELIHAMHGEKKALVESVLEGRLEADKVKWKDLWTALWPESNTNKAAESPWKKPPSQREEGLF
ncbi:MAG: DEAD/DEAH box helicase [Chitinophagaceae bacterium]|nr:DEAD/DEAH box helicase [Oligoflexus sp.]